MHEIITSYCLLYSLTSRVPHDATNYVNSDVMFSRFNNCIDASSEVLVSEHVKIGLLDFPCCIYREKGQTE